MRHVIILLSLLFGTTIPAIAQVSVNIGIGLPNANIGMNFPSYPRFEQVPGYPVYYAPQVDSNYFFYDGLYWVYANDYWYASSWYNGPWSPVGPMVVPVYILRVPVRYYREPPMYFRGWQQEAPPRWDDHWGNDWRRQHTGWDHWNRNSMPPPAPLPTYQQQYSGGRYPSFEQQRTITSQNYHYQPHEAVIQQHYQRYLAPTAPGVAQQNPPRNQHQQPPLAQNPSATQQDENPAKPPHPAEPSQPVPQHKPPPPPPPSVQDHGSSGPGESAMKQPQQHQPQQQQPYGQHDASPGQAENPVRQREEQHPQQQPSGPEHGSPGQGANVTKESKPDQGRDQSGEGVRDKETPHDNR